MHNISYQERAKEKTAKGSFLPFGIVLGVLTLLALIAGIGLFIAYPLLIDTDLNSVVDYAKDLIATEDLTSLVALIAQCAILVGGIVFAICKIIKMFKTNFKRSGNVNVGLSAGFGIFFFAFSQELIALIGNNKAIGDTVFIYSFVGIFALSLIYELGVMIYTRKLWEKSGAKLNAVSILAIIACMVAIVGGILSVDLINFKASLNLDYYKQLALYSYPVQMLVLIVDAFMSGISSTAIPEIIIELFAIATMFATLILASKLVFALIFDFFKLGADRNFVRGSNYFSKTSALKTAAAFSFTFVFNIILQIIAVLVSGSDITSLFTSASFVSSLSYYISIFVVVLVLSIISASIARKDKKKAKDEEYSYSDGDEVEIFEEENSQEEIIDLTAEPTEEVVEEPIEEVVEEVIEDPVQEEIIEEEPVQEEIIVEEVVEQPVQEEVKVEEPKVETFEEPKAKEEPVHQQPFAQPQYPYGMPYPYAPYPYPPYPQYPVMPMPYPYAQPMPYQVPQPAPQPTVICIPIQQPAPQPVPVQPYQYVQPQAPVYAQPQAPVEPQPAPQSAPAPQPAPVSAETLATEDEFDDEENKPFFIERKTLDEKFNELSPTYKKYYRDIMKYAENKEGVKRNKSTYNDSVVYGRDCIVKIAIKQGKVVCSFSLINYEVKSMLKNGKSAREQLTVVKVVDATSYALAKQSVDMAYKLAQDAKEARHQEQLRKRREARAAKAQNK